MKYITFQGFSFNHLFFIFYFISSFIRKRIHEPLFGEHIQISGLYYQMYINTISHFFTIIPYLISKCLTKKEIAREEEIKRIKGTKSIKYIYSEQEEIITRPKSLLKYTLVVSIFDFSAELFINIFYFFNDKTDVLWYYSLRIYSIFNTIMQYIVSYFVLKTYFYKHHYLSFSINFFCIFIFLIIDIITIVENEIRDYQYYILIIMRLFRLTCFAFGDGYSKKVLYSEFLSPYSLLLYKAIYETIFLIIISIPFIFLKTNDLYIDNDNIFKGFPEHMSGMKLLYSFFFMICQFFYNLFLMIIIDRFSPSHLPLAYFLESLGFAIYDIITKLISGKEIDWLSYINFVVYIILFIGAMIHNEIIIINACGFNSYTKLNMNQKFQEETKNIDKILSDEESNNEDYDEEKKLEKSGIILHDLS